MFFRRSKRNLDKLREQYLQDLQKYLKHNSFAIVQRIKNGMLSSKNIGNQEIRIVLGYNYPKARWINSTDDASQIICLFKEIGYSNITRIFNGVQCNPSEMCEAIINNYISVNGKKIMDRLEDCCVITNGRISYSQMQEVLGINYSEIDNTSEEDVNECILMFLRGTKLPFKHNDVYIYLP